MAPNKFMQNNFTPLYSSHLLQIWIILLQHFHSDSQLFENPNIEVWKNSKCFWQTAF